MSTRIDEFVGGIYRISTWQPQYGITFNQFLIADERPALIHTGMHDLHGPIRSAIREVLDPAKLAYVVLLHWEGDENGAMEQFMKEAPKSELIGSIFSIQLNASALGLPNVRAVFAMARRSIWGRANYDFWKRRTCIIGIQ